MSTLDRSGQIKFEEKSTLCRGNYIEVKKIVRVGPNPSDVITNSIGLKLVYIPAGSFTMGSPSSENQRDNDEGPQHRVRISKGFYMGQGEVTVGQFRRFLEEAGYRTDAEKEGWSSAWDGSKWDNVNGTSWKNPGFSQSENHPVVCISWNDAKSFCEWLSRKEGKIYMLPTEAQWEYACRAGTQTTYCWGNSPDDGSGWCNVADLTAKEKWSAWTVFNWRDGYVFTAPVGSFRQNAFGLYDMHGNGWEWCQDWYDGNYYSNSPEVDPKGPDTGSARVLRGGSWGYYPWHCRSAGRDRYAPDDRCNCSGFRVVSLDF
jgi:formylglycine-generating enzyme required for sulfatase activity